MKVIGVRTPEVIEVAVSVGLGVEIKNDERRNRRSRHIALRPLGERYRVVIEFDDESEQVVACLHGHEAFLLALFERFPDARVVTSIADYRGLDGFVEIQPAIRAKYLAHYGNDPCGCEGGS